MRARAWWDQLRPVHSAEATRTLVEMRMAKEKWGVRYTEEQERALARSFARQKHQAQHGQKEETRVEQKTVESGCA
jgi:hypothetical protein